VAVRHYQILIFSQCRKKVHKTLEENDEEMDEDNASLNVGTGSVSSPKILRNIATLTI